jgi:hypothetical protein
MSSFAKTLAEVVLDGARADEQLGANLRVRLTLAGEAPGAARVVAKRSSSSKSGTSSSVVSAASLPQVR